MMKWDSELYDKKHDFVSEYGKGLMEYMPEQKVSKILDLGCGTGDLTWQLTAFAGDVVGVDSSESMIEQAKCKYGNIDFSVANALALPFENEFDIVFSNAVFHWIKDHEKLLQNIRRALKTPGRLICEFGGHGNIAVIENTFAQACSSVGLNYQPKFNFPETDAFANLLERNGFCVEKIFAFDRPTPLKDGESGLRNWMMQFFASELSTFTPEQQSAVLDDTERRCRDALWNGKEWVADYRRLRAVACKK